MNRQQKISITVGWLLLVVAALFPPWTYRGHGPHGGSFAESSYAFLFFPPYGGAELNFSKLAVEWIVIVLIVGGLFLAFKRPAVTHIDPIQPRRGGRRHIALTIVLAVLTLGLGLFSYAAVKETQCLEAGIYNVKAFVNSEMLPPWLGLAPIEPPSQPVGELHPLPQPQQQLPPLPKRIVPIPQDIEKTCSAVKQQTLEKIRDQLDRLY